MAESESPLVEILKDDLSQKNSDRIIELEKMFTIINKRLDVQHQTIEVLARKIKELEK